MITKAELRCMIEDRDVLIASLQAEIASLQAELQRLKEPRHNERGAGRYAMPDITKQRIVDMRTAGDTVQRIIERTGYARSTVYNVLRDAGLTKQEGN